MARADETALREDWMDLAVAAEAAREVFGACAELGADGFTKGLSDALGRLDEALGGQYAEACRGVEPDEYLDEYAPDGPGARDGYVSELAGDVARELAYTRGALAECRDELRSLADALAEQAERADAAVF